MSVDSMDGYSVSNKIIDEHHFKLFNLFEKIQILIEEDTCEVKLKSVLLEIKDYTFYHFSYEERLMEIAGYPDLLEHKRLHRNFIDLIDNIMIEVKEGHSKDACSRTYDVLNNWLKNHIMIVDKRYIEYLKD